MPRELPTGVLRLLLVPALALSLLNACSAPGAPPAPERVPLAVLGDSDSHAFQDRISFPPGGSERGGPYRATAFQWTEVLDRLRGHQLDQGAWGEWGRRGRMARVAAWFGADARAPRKEDFRFNFARSGARCADLDSGLARQVQPLLDLMAEAPEAWRKGVVVLRIGINDLGVKEPLEAFAREGGSAANRATVDACLAHVRSALDALSAAHPDTAQVIVGVLDNVDWPPNAGRWSTPTERRNIAAVLDRFDNGLRAIGSAAPRRVFMDDRAFFRERVGARAPDGSPAYRDLVIDAPGAAPVRIAYGQGDAPGRLFLGDGHMGTGFNAAWAQALVTVLHRDLGLPVEPITDAELSRFLMPLLDAPPEA